MTDQKLDKLAPVVIFVYNRLKNTKEVVEALQKNHLAGETEVIVYSDGPANERAETKVQAVRDYLKTVSGFKSFTVVERPENYFVERNIIEGVTEVVNKYGQIIVLEDDGVTAPNFLNFMNEALNTYAEYKKVMHIATFTFIKMPEDFRSTFFWRYTENTGGGWATWADRWSLFKHFSNEEEARKSLTLEQQRYLNLDGAVDFFGTLSHKIIPWDICWYMTLVRNNGLAVNSPHALTRNNGLYSGTHFSPLNRILGKHPFATKLDTNEQIDFSLDIKENEMALAKLKAFYSSLGRRKRDRILHYFVRTLVFLRVTKLLKWWFK